MRRTLRKLCCTIVTMAMLSGLAGVALADVVSPGQNVFGMTSGDWSAAWWQYVLPIPAATNPAADTTGDNCGIDQSTGPVFFLAGNFTPNASVTRNCTVPAGKTLVIPIINTECSTLEPAPFHGNNEKELRACAAACIDGVDISTLALSIDEQAVLDLGTYRAQSPVFSFHIPPKNVIGLKVPASGATGSSVSDGYWAIVQPLATGRHSVQFKGAVASGPCGGFSVDVSYDLMVQ